MASLASAVFGGGIEGAGKGIAAVVNAIKGKNPEDAAKLQEILGRHSDLIVQTEAEIEKARIEANVSLNQTAAGNIQAEAKANWYTAAARPSIIWCWVVLMVYNYAIASLIHRAPATFPDLFWEISGAAILGYVVARGVDKNQGGAGGNIQLTPWLKINSNGDSK